MKPCRLYFSFLLFLLLASVLYPQAKKTTIEEISNNPGMFNNDAVEIEGLVTQYVPSTSSTTSYYLIKGDYGGVIKVNTSESAPETNKKYKVSGTVYIDPNTHDAFISEKSKNSLETVTPPPPPPPSGTDPLIYVIIILGIILLGSFIYFQASKGGKGKEKSGDKGSSSTSERQRQTSFQSSPQSASSGETIRMTPPPPQASSEFKTIKLAPSSPKTMTFIPGLLEIVSGEDKGKSFRIAGYPTSEGSVVSIGREAISGERAYAHIQLDERFRTVSRRQAELIYKDKKLVVKNLSETNLTQVDGIELRPGECMELKPNARIRTGELEFQYKLN